MHMRADVAQDIRDIFNAPNLKEAERLLEISVKKYQFKASRLSAWMEENLFEGFSVFQLPVDHRKKTSDNQSGFSVGRQVIGTMTTTLLLAYAGGYLTLLMIFKVKDPRFMRMINLKIVAAEIMRTLIDSIGLVMVAPITAIVGGAYPCQDH